MIKIAVIGLGYVGLPLARLFATKYRVVGFDVNKNRISELKTGIDTTLEVDNDILNSVIKSENDQSNGLFFSCNNEDLSDCNFFIVTVPTPIDKFKKPDLTPLIKASETVGKALENDDIVVYESTVFPGATEEYCVPILETFSGLKFNKDFFVGYSPERINPGDKKHTVEKILKITSGSTPSVAKKIDEVYKSIIEAGTHLAPSIKVAEAAKVIENSQRDINIAFVNELAKIFNAMNIDTLSVLEAASTKWNFMPFRPGLVGGHCIGVDPYYLAQKAQEVGYHPEIILAGRRLNDSMGQYIAGQLVKAMIKRDININNAKVLMLGITFKENCPDIRNSKAVDIYNALIDYGADVEVYDPWANPESVLKEYNIKIVSSLNEEEKYMGVILAVAHNEFIDIDYDLLREKQTVVYDVKGILGEKADTRL